MNGVYGSNTIRIIDNGLFKDIKISTITGKEKLLCYNYYFDKFSCDNYEVIKDKCILCNYSFNVKERDLEAYHKKSIITTPNQKLIMNDGSGISLKDIDKDFIILFSIIGSGKKTARSLDGG